MTRSLTMLGTLSTLMTVAALATITAFAASPLDGAYHGDSIVTVGVPSTCGKDFKLTITINNGAFEYVWDKSTNIVIPISAATDGSLSGERFVSARAGAKASGRITGKTLEMDLVGRQCTRHVVVKKA